MQADVSSTVWILTIAGLVAVMAFDLVIVGRRQGPIAVSSARKWILFYVSLALAFSVFLLFEFNGSASSSFLAVYITEYSLSADNLFVFMILMARFNVPAIAVDRILYIGIIIALVFRGLFIMAGSAAVSRFSWIFYIFGAFLLYTAVKLAFASDDEEEQVKDETRVVALMRKVLRTTEEYDGRKFVTRVDGRRFFTPAILVIGAISVADLVFALDSIPAALGITTNTYLVLTANAFALMGLRQLYFLIGDLLKRMIYLGLGLSVLLAFIGVKLIFEALHGSGVDTVGPITIPHISPVVSLSIVIGILAVTAIASFIRRPRTVDS